MGSTVSYAKAALGGGGLLPKGVYYHLGGLYTPQREEFRGLAQFFVGPVALVRSVLLLLYERFRVAAAMLVTTLLVSAVTNRMRPILMATLAAILALLPPRARSGSGSGHAAPAGHLRHLGARGPGALGLDGAARAVVLDARPAEIGGAAALTSDLSALIFIGRPVPPILPGGELAR